MIMLAPSLGIITVLRKKIERGYKHCWYSFSSHSLIGLYMVVTEQDLEKGIIDLPDMIAQLIKADTGLIVEVKPEKVFGLSKTEELEVFYFSIWSK